MNKQKFSMVKKSHDVVLKTCNTRVGNSIAERDII